MIEIFHFLKFSELIKEMVKYFPLGKMELTHCKFCPYPKISGQKALKIFVVYVHKSILFVNELWRVLIVSLVFTIIFYFLRTLLIAL